MVEKYSSLRRRTRACCVQASLFWVGFLWQSLIWLQAASLYVTKRQVRAGCVSVPLTEKVAFKAILQIGNRVQVPRLIRWRYKLETDQILKVSVSVVNVWCSPQTFFARVGNDGRITIPKLTLALLGAKKQDLEHYVMDIILEP